ncbi:hypothetical protein ALI22I_04465 [Saccharothrix sp. ALI-22-I]|nr:hypothetical protein ALI22I_04465 [Saccharothrix sp. ALI-22-I]
MGDVNLQTGVPVRTRYRFQVKQVAPPELIGREAELAELTTFCTDPSTAGSYLWLRAGPWAGKSALMSWFVLHPPPGVQVVSFFVTASLADQSDRTAFIDNVLEQLLAMLGEDLPPLLTAATRESHLLGLLAQAATLCQERGEHFVLAVDGLDEDRGVDGSPDAHSIAALLPRTGVRVIVAGRPDPDLPDDVPPDHPLYRSSIVRHLSTSPKARAVRDVMIRELKHLIRGTSTQQDLLGFMTAAAGGLAVRDLAELAATSDWHVEDELRTTAGRSFSRRPGTPPVYVLAHDQLYSVASEMLGPRLDHYRERLHIWADSYRVRQWPSDTPRYLVHGYAATLTAIGDVPRALEYVTDPRRHDLVSASTGHDHIVLDEIKAVQRVLLRQQEPDLVALARLAVHRTSLYSRNDWIPAHLPSVWAMVGRLDHAEALLNVIGDLVVRSRALTAAAVEFHRAGEQQRAARLLDEAEDLAKSFNQWWGSWPYAELAEAAMRIKDYERTRRAVDAIKHPEERAEACASLAHVALDDLEHDDASNWYTEAEETLKQVGGRADVTAIAKVAAAAASLGHSSRATDLADGILTEDSPVAPDIADIADRFLDLPSVDRTVSDHDKAKAANALAGAGLSDVARAVTATISDVDGQEYSLLDVTRALATLDLDKAEELARTASDVKYLSARLAAVAVAAGRNGDPSRASRLVDEVDETLEELPQGQWRRFTIMAIAVAKADAGAIEEAESMVRSHMLPSEDITGALSVAVALVRRHEIERASHLVTLTEDAARPASTSIDERRLLRWVQVMADFAEFDRAERLVRSFSTEEVRSAGSSIITEGLAVNGAIDRAEQTLHTIADPRLQRRPRLELIRILLAQAQDNRATQLARTAETSNDRAAALTFIATTARKADLLDEVVGVADNIAELEARIKILLSALRAAADLGDRPRVTALWHHIRTVVGHTGRRPVRIDGSRRLFMPLPDPLRTLTEIAESVDREPRFPNYDNTPAGPVAGPGALWLQENSLPEHKKLAHNLATHDWFDLVDELVEVEPDAFRAILLELDRLGGRDALHPS